MVKKKVVNKVNLLWDELKIHLEKSWDFLIESIQGDAITIKALTPFSFSKETIYLQIFSKIVPMCCSLNLVSIYNKGENMADDSLVFEFIIYANRDLYYKGKIEIIKDIREVKDVPK